MIALAQVLLAQLCLASHGGGYRKRPQKFEDKDEGPLRTCCNFDLPLFDSYKRMPMEFLPDPSAESCQRSTQSQHVPPIYQELLDKLAKVYGREGETCENTIQIAPVEYGFGSMMHSLVKPAWKAAATGRSLNYHGLDVWQNESKCAAQDFSCFFEPISSCPRIEQTQEMDDESLEFRRNATVLKSMR